MNLLIVGNDAALAECQARLGDAHQYTHAESFSKALAFDHVDVVFDFSEAHSLDAIHSYASQTKALVFVNTVFTTLSRVVDEQSTHSAIIGFCGLPTFFNREVLEVTVRDDSSRGKLTTVCQLLNLKYIVVKDQVGFVTPRVVSMIINEAFETLGDSVASRHDIDLSMKLGTSYPFGPFQWAERIGVDNVRKLLNAVYAATGENRYKPVI